MILPTHPGFGQAPEATDIDTVDDLAYLYLDLLDENDLRDVVVIGCSLGGWIAAEMAVKSTARLSRLVLAAPLGIKVGDRETRDIPDIFALPEEEVTRLQYHDTAQGRVDYASLSDDELTAIARNRERPPCMPGSRISTIPSCASACAGSRFRRCSSGGE